MEQIRDLTKRLIANSFKELMLVMPFEKITIKVITDHANVIRPTFYNHFHDKYEMMEWILVDEILDPAKQLIVEGKAAEGMHHIFTKFYEDKNYYRRAFEVTGQNGFAETLTAALPRMLLEAAELLKLENMDSPLVNQVLSREVIAQYYSSGLIALIQKEIETSDDVPVEQFTKAYTYLATHTIFDVILR